MELTGLHLLLTYQCTLECDHCFVWGGQWQTGTLTLEGIREILRQAEELGAVRSIYFEGGEPFLFHPVLVEGARLAAGQGFGVGVVSNAYWATSVEDATAWLRPLAGLVDDLSLSGDLFHSGDASSRDRGPGSGPGSGPSGEALSQEVENARAAARALGIPVGVITIAPPEEGEGAVGQLPPGESAVMYRGRAADALSERAPRRPWATFDECPWEDLREPGRVHVDPLGWVHICQGITVGNLFETSLREICEGYVPEDHPMTGPLLAGGPAELARRHAFRPEGGYADACHLCYRAREALRDRFPGILGPDQMYGVTPS